MANNVNLEFVGIHQIRSEYVDWGNKSASPAIHKIASLLSSLMAESSELVPGPDSEIISEVEETTASRFSNETNRVIRFTANTPDGPVDFDIVVQLAAPTSFTFSGE